MSETTTLSKSPLPKLDAGAGNGLAGGLIALGLAGIVSAFVLGGADRGFSSILTGLLAPLWLAVGALFFIAVHSIVNATWTVPLRRLMEGLTLGLWPALVGFVAIAIAVVVFGGVYDWAGSDREQLFHAADGTKKAWMTAGRWTATGLIVFGALILVRQILVGLSLRQDGGAVIGERHVRWSVITLFVLGYGFTLLVWDLLLTLHVNWVSAIWGFYCFVGALQSFLAVLILVVVWQRGAAMRDVIRSHHLHDLGTWMVGWACITAYIAFVQYTIIWYANLDEETFWMVMRTQHGYGTQYVIEALLRNLAPFALLMSQRFRADPRMLVIVAVLVLVGNLLDLAWIVVPAFSPNAYRIPLPEILAALGFAGAGLLLALRFWRSHGLVPAGDPRLLPSINAEHLH